MKLTPRFGIDQLLFGMKQPDVTAIYGKPDKQFIDEEENSIWVYNAPMLRLTFYEDEDFKLGYIISANPDLQLADKQIIGQTPDAVKAKLTEKSFQLWEEEDFDLAENHFNEANWLILQSEFGKIVKVELGAIINDKDEFEWKFRK
ncbi:MAG TPA: hypothetical protein VF676_04530 [Flavobacterium sp.]|jgi:hypothetical protein